jgi:hypothetical protein
MELVAVFMVQAVQVVAQQARLLERMERLTLAAVVVVLMDQSVRKELAVLDSSLFVTRILTTLQLLRQDLRRSRLRAGIVFISGQEAGA